MSKDKNYLIRLMQGNDFPKHPLSQTFFEDPNHHILYCIIVQHKTRECAEIYKHILAQYPEKKQELLNLLMDITRELDRRLVHEKNIETGENND